MSRSLDDTPQIEQMQQATLESDLWNTEVVPRLPRELASQACSLKAFVRVREVKSASPAGICVVCSFLSAGGSLGGAHWAG